MPARLRHTGPVINFRLPLDLHAQLSVLAAARGESPGAYVRRQIERSLTGTPGVPVPGPPERPARASRQHDPTCRCALCSA